MSRARAVLTLAACAALAGWLGARLRSSRDAAAPSAGARAVAVPAGETSAPTAADRVSESSLLGTVKIPERLPPFTLHAPDGKRLSIDAFRGRSLIVNFWATWCAPCRKEIPLLEAVDAAFRSRQFTVVGVAVDRPEAVAQFARRFKISYPLMSGEADALRIVAALGVAEPVYPFTVFTDDRGRIVALYLGELRKPQIDAILTVVEQLNADRIDLTAARHSIAAALARLDPDRAAG